MKSCRHSDGYTDDGNVACVLHTTGPLKRCAGCTDFIALTIRPVPSADHPRPQQRPGSDCKPCRKKGKPIWQRDWMELL